MYFMYFTHGPRTNVASVTKLFCFLGYGKKRLVLPMVGVVTDMVFGHVELQKVFFFI